MIITAALAWWNEPVDALERLVGSLAGVVDRLVAVDGRWKLMPGPGRLSTPEEAIAIRVAAVAAGIDLLLEDAPARAGRWTQIEKRDHLMRAAAEGSDWVLVVDGDTHVSYADTVALRGSLSAAEEDVALLEVTNVGWGVRATWPKKRRLVYRAAAGVTVVTGHNGYQAADGRWLNGDTAHVALAPACDVSRHLKLLHTIDARDRVRRGQQGDYYAARAGAKEEAWATV